MRVFSHTCSNTEIVCALGCAQLLVGVDSDSDYPPEVVAGLPKTGRDLEGPQMDPPIHLVLTEVEADIFRVTGRARMLDVGNKAFPGISYTAKTFPGLTR